MTITKGKKYELIADQSIRIADQELFRIRALVDIGEHVKAGDEGGYIESEKNLIQDGSAWIADDAMVYGDAKIMDDAMVFSGAVVSGHAVVSGCAQVHDRASVYGHAVVTGHAHVVGDSQVYGRARVSGGAKVMSGAKVFDDAEVFGNAVLSGETRVGDNAQVSGAGTLVTVSNIGGSQITATFFTCADGMIRVRSDRGFHGTIDAFRMYASRYFGDTGHDVAYMAAADYARCVLDARAAS